MAKEVEDKDVDKTLLAELEKSADDVFGGEGVDDVKKLEAEKSDEKTPTSGTEKTDEEKKAADTAAAVADPAKDAKDPTKVENPDADKKPEGKDGKDAAAKSEKDADEELTAEDLSTAGMKEETARKFEKVIGSNQKLKTQLDEAQSAIKERDEILVSFKQMVEETGLNQQQLERTLQIGALINRNPVKAAEVLHGLAADLAKRHGVVLNAVDLLEGFEDLQKKVQAAELSREDAIELAKARRRTNTEKEQQTQVQQTSKAQEAFESRVNAARAEIATFLKEAEKDVNFSAIATRLKNDAKFASDNLDPGKWLSYIKQQHAAYMDMAAQVAGSQKRETPIIDDSGHKPDPKPQPKTLGELAENML